MKNYSTENVSIDDAHGELEFKLTNDYLFRAVFQTNKKALKGLLCALLHLDEKQIKSVEITNPIELGKITSSKEFRLDIKLILNGDKIINLEMQVNNQGNWEQRSVSYTCRMYDNLNSGDDYKTVRDVINIGILDFTLKEEFPEFYSTYKIMNEKIGTILSNSFIIKTLDLTNIDLATEEDRKYNVDKWARLFKAGTWEALKELAENSEYIKEAAKSMYIMAEDENVREMIIQRMEFEADQKYLHNKLQTQEQQLQTQKQLLQEKDKKIAELEEELARNRTLNDSYSEGQK